MTDEDTAPRRTEEDIRLALIAILGDTLEAQGFAEAVACNTASESDRGAHPIARAFARGFRMACTPEHCDEKHLDVLHQTVDRQLYDVIRAIVPDANDAFCEYVHDFARTAL